MLPIKIPLLAYRLLYLYNRGCHILNRAPFLKKRWDFIFLMKKQGFLPPFFKISPDCYYTKKSDKIFIGLVGNIQPSLKNTKRVEEKAS